MKGAGHPLRRFAFMAHTAIHFYGEERRNFGGGGGHSKCVKGVSHLDIIDSNEVIKLKRLHLKINQQSNLDYDINMYRHNSEL